MNSLCVPFAVKKNQLNFANATRKLSIDSRKSATVTVPIDKRYHILSFDAPNALNGTTASLASLSRYWVIWVVDSMFDNVQVFDPDGRLLLAVGSSGNADGQLYLPTGIHIDADGRIHVADAGNSRIQILLLKEGVQ